MNTNINAADLENKKQMALKLPHALLVVDQLLKVKITDGQVQATLGFTSPGDGITAVVTLVMPACFAAELSKALKSVKT